MKRALVTGSTGFIGRHLVKVLSEHGYQVACLVRETSNRKSLQGFAPEYRIGDLADLDSLSNAVKNVDVVFHLAGLTKSPRVSELMRANRDGASHIARVCSEQPNPPTLIFASSLAATGPSFDIGARVETDDFDPVSSYGRSKLAGELAVRDFANQVPTSIVRPPIVFGEGDRDVYNVFKGIAKTGIHVIPSLNDYFFSAIHARDLSFAMLRVAESGERLSGAQVSDGTYFVADEQVFTYADLGQMIAKVLGRQRVTNLRMPHHLLCAFAAINEVIGYVKGEGRIVNLDKTREAKAGSWVCSTEKLKREVGFNCVRTLEPRLRQTAEWYQQKGWLPTRQNMLQVSS